MTRIRSISVTDFRSIRGSISVPLDAPVVIIHGPNGSGKTSLLSAIELGLAGQVPSLARVDPNYVGHLVHKEADRSVIQVSADGPGQHELTASLNVSRSEISGQPLLGRELARFYSERCFLAQATLGRLLELYEDKDARRSDSRLTKFVKDLLGLDQLDALIDGLHDAGDVRRLRTTVPAFWEARENVPSLEREIQRLQSEFASVVNAEMLAEEATKELLSGLSIPATFLADTTALSQRLNSASEEGELQRLAGHSRSLGSIELQWSSMTEHAGQANTEVEARAAASASGLKAWEATDGQLLSDIFNAAAKLFPDRQIISEEGPDSRYRSVVRAVQAERERIDQLLELSAANEIKLENLNQDIERAQARGLLLEQQLAEHVQDAGQLAKVLSEVLPHVHSEDCPVCGRDFAEVSRTDLRAHVTDRINQLARHASSLQALSNERAQTLSALAGAKRQREALEGLRLEASVRDDAKTRQAQLSEIAQSLVGLEESAAAGQRLTEENVVASRALTSLHARDFQGAAIREMLVDIAEALSLGTPEESESVAETVARLSTRISMRTAELEKSLAARRRALVQLTEVDSFRARRQSFEKEIQEFEARIAELSEKKERAEKQLLDARELAKRAREVRTNIVRRVFNDSLNSIWRELFVRLAPEEPFVPSFALPENPSGAVEAVLETLYRSGGKGGNPRAMLSAGNLNTAALTLFLSLHLSVVPQLPWLVIDDPVQSMDEVHIAQFAALLRTLSKEHGRQVIIAVHEKQLFDYLALELAPAYPNDRLITVEMSRGADGTTLMNYSPVIWRPDTAIAA